MKTMLLMRFLSSCFELGRQRLELFGVASGRIELNFHPAALT